MSIRRSLTQLICPLILFSPTIAATAQSNSIWPLPPSQAMIVRDSEALALLRATIVAMNPQGKPTVSDYVLEGSITKWRGKVAGGTLKEQSVGLVARSASVSINHQQVYSSFRANDAKVSTGPDGIPNSASDERLFEDIPYMPVPLIEDLVSNPLDSVQYISESQIASSLEEHIHVILRAPYWRPAFRDAGTAAFDLFLNTQTHLPSRITGAIHYDGHLAHKIRYGLTFSDYRAEEGRVVAHEIDEQYAGGILNSFAITGIHFNTGITAATLDNK